MVDVPAGASGPTSRAVKLEIAIALGALAALLAIAPVALYAAIARAGLAGLGSMLALAGVDPPTLADGTLAILRSLAIVVPVVVAFARAERHRLAWAPLTVIPLLLALSLAPHGIVGAGRVAALTLVAVLACIAQSRRALAWTAGIPAIVALHPTTTTHQRWTLSIPGVHAAMVERCRENDGERPAHLEPALVSPHYYSLTPVDGSRLLLTGEGRESLWVRRDPDGALRIAERSRISGNYWAGTAGEGRIWLAHRDDVRSVRWAGDHEELEYLPLVGTRHEAEVDALDAVYDAATRSVFVGELAFGGLIEVPVSGAPPRRHALDLFYLQLASLGPGRLAGISTTELVVIDTRDAEIVERQPAALCAGGVAVCAADEAVAVTDFAGRVRLFERGSDGYRFRRSGAAPSPRRVAFSPDCAWLAVTSADDETVVIMARDDLSIRQSHRLGPGLRDVTWLPDGDLLVVDACTVTRLRPPS